MPDSPIGLVLSRSPLRRDARDRLKITGALDGGYVCVSADTFDTPFWVSSSELSRDYGAKIDVVESDHDRLRRLDLEANERAAARRFRGTATKPAPAPESPEGIFRAAEPEANDDA